MSRRKSYRISNIFNVNGLLWLALVLALAGSLKHLAATFTSIDGNTFFGYIQAVAIDAGLFALAYSIKVRKVAKRSIKPLWFGVTLFTGISIYGNLAYGLLATSGSLPGWILTSRPYVLAGSLPILVLFLSELLSDDRQYLAMESKKAAQRQAKQVAITTGKTELTTPKTEILPSTNDNLVSVNNGRQTTKVKRMAELVILHKQNPHTTITELATLLNVSRGTVRNYVNELGIEPAKNGNGRA